MSTTAPLKGEIIETWRGHTYILEAMGGVGIPYSSFIYKLQHFFRVLYLAIVLFPIGSKRSAASSASRLFLGMGGGGDITVVAADEEDVPVERTATHDAFVNTCYL